MGPEKDAVLFVYNADKGTIEGIKDYLHKLTSSSTYQCRLCNITYGSLGMRKDWREFLNGLPLPAEFMHRDEFRDTFPARTERLPAVFMLVDKSPELLISSEEINQVRDLDDLMELVLSALRDREVE